MGSTASDDGREPVRVADVAQLVVIGFHAALAVVLLVGDLTEPTAASSGWLWLVTVSLVAITALVWRRTPPWRVWSAAGLVLIGCGGLAGAAGGSLGWWTWAAWVVLALAVVQAARDRRPRLDDGFNGPGAG